MSGTILQEGCDMDWQNLPHSLSCISGAAAFSARGFQEKQQRVGARAVGCQSWRHYRGHRRPLCNHRYHVCHLPGSVILCPVWHGHHIKVLHSHELQ